MELPKRKPNRLKKYDYSENGAYFITMCTKDKQCILGEIVCVRPNMPLKTNGVGDGVLDVPPPKQTKQNNFAYNELENRLTKCGEIVQKTINEIDNTYPNVGIENYIVMPNHVHMIIHIKNEPLTKNGSSGTPTPTPANQTIPKIISTFKRFTNKQIGFPIWQRSYHDHIIRNENEYIDIYNYVEYNAYNWRTDCFYIKSSPNTSFN